MNIIHNCGKYLNYNIGDRYGQRKMIPASPDKGDRDYALEVIKGEIGRAIECGANKIVFASGPDFPDNREEAKKRLSDFIQDAFKDVPQNVIITIEPTGRDLDKHFLLGPLDESAAFTEEIRRQGMNNFFLLLDMGHIPLLGISIREAIDQTAGNIMHIHLGNCIIKNKTHPLYGDNHVPWGVAGGEYDEDDVSVFLKAISDAGYCDSFKPYTISFEMRPYDNLSPDLSIDRFMEIFDKAWASVWEGEKNGNR